MTLQQQYNLIKEGKGNKGQFLKHARSLFPEYFNQYTNYDNAISVLKSKQIISEGVGGVVGKGFDIWDWKKILAEETKAVEKETSKEVLDNQKNAYNNSDMKNADNVNFNEIMKGFYAEMKDPENAKKTGNEIKAMVVKNLAKDCLYYTKNGEFGVKGVGYTDEAPGLGKNTQPTTKESTILGGNDKVDSDSDIVKNSLVGSAKKNVQDSLSKSEAKTSNPKKVKEMPDKGVTGTEKKMKLQEGEQKLRSLIHNIIKEELSKESIEINGKTVKTYTQNGDTSYNVTYDDGTKDIIYVNNDGWDEINQLHRNAIGDDAYRKQFSEQFSKNQNDPSYIANYIAGGFADYIMPGSEKFTYGPDEEGTYHLEFQLEFDNLSYNTPEEEEKELQNQIGGSSGGGPGQAFSRTNVSYDGEKEGKYIFSVHQRGGYDI
jgi:hypothetical protein